MPYVNQERLMLKFPSNDTADPYDVFFHHINSLGFFSVELFIVKKKKEQQKKTISRTVSLNSCYTGVITLTMG